MKKGSAVGLAAGLTILKNVFEASIKDLFLQTLVDSTVEAVSGSSNCFPDLQRYQQVCNSVQGYNVASVHGSSDSSDDVSCMSNEK